jgi:hypothetical protein
MTTALVRLIQRFKFAQPITVFVVVPFDSVIKEGMVGSKCSIIAFAVGTPCSV